MKKTSLTTSIVLLIVGAIILAIGFFAPYVFEILHRNEIPVGVIAGGIDFPSYQDMLLNHWYGLWSIFVHLGGAMILTSGFALIFHNTVSKHCERITTLSSLGLSISGAACLMFFLFTLSTSGDNHMHYPYANPLAAFCVIVFTLISVFLLAWYWYNRFKRFSLRGILLDILLTVVYFPAFSWFWGVSIDFLQNMLKNVI